MNDRDLIFKYLNSFYFVAYKDSDFILCSHNSSEFKNKVELLTELKSIFKGVKKINNNLEEWCDESINQFIKNIDEFLGDCYLELGPTNWVVRHKLYGNINYSFLRNQNSFDKKYHEAIIYFFEKWYDNKIYEFSEKMMRNF